MSEDNGANAKKMSIIVTKGTLDWAYPPFILGTTAAAQDKLDGPVAAFVERVIDGDTLLVRARVWLEQEVRVLVRVGGIDAPELKGRCQHERRLALMARTFVENNLKNREIILKNIHHGKYAGRVIANVIYSSNIDLASELLRNKLVRQYRKGRRKAWCSKGDPA
jgi:endonuclease YncB( thermonuclease family)